MQKTDQLTLEYLRTLHSSIQYQDYAWEIVKRGLKLTFAYHLDPDIQLEHCVYVHGVTQEMLDKVGDQQLRAYVFHIGMIELLSYWKLAAPSEIVIESGALTETQKDWWQSLLIKGMGEYFFVNQIDFTQEDFVKIIASEPRVGALGGGGDFEKSASLLNGGTGTAPVSQDLSKIKVLVPVGGGKDSAVTLELLKNLVGKMGTLLVNPTPASQGIAELSEAYPYIVERQFDPKLFELNAAGYLNGHVPVSASFAFISLLVAKLFDFQYIAISNEASSNESNVSYLGHHINHQFSKTHEFERSLQAYVGEFYPPRAPFYFSFLRPLFELQIAKLFAASCQAYFGEFRSCNRGQKTNSWCGQCPKCLFAFTILSVWLGVKITTDIFGKNLFEDVDLLPTALELLGKTRQKPFECIGTYDETWIALGLALGQIEADVTPQHNKLPALLQQLKKGGHIVSLSMSDPQVVFLLNGFDQRHSLPKNFADVLKSAG